MQWVFAIFLTISLQGQTASTWTYHTKFRYVSEAECATALEEKRIVLTTSAHVQFYPAKLGRLECATLEQIEERNKALEEAGSV